MLDAQFARGDDTLGLVAHVEENFVAVNLDDGSRNQVSVIEEFESLFNSGEEILSRSDVVDSNLLGYLGCC